MSKNAKKPKRSVTLKCNDCSSELKQTVHNSNGYRPGHYIVPKEGLGDARVLMDADGAPSDVPDNGVYVCPSCYEARGGQVTDTLKG